LGSTGGPGRGRDRRRRLKQWDKAVSLYETLRDELPPLQGLLKKKIENAQKMFAQSHGPGGKQLKKRGRPFDRGRERG